MDWSRTVASVRGVFSGSILPSSTTRLAEARETSDRPDRSKKRLQDDAERAFVRTACRYYSAPGEKNYPAPGFSAEKRRKPGDRGVFDGEKFVASRKFDFVAKTSGRSSTLSFRVKRRRRPSFRFEVQIAKNRAFGARSRVFLPERARRSLASPPSPGIIRESGRVEL